MTYQTTNDFDLTRQDGTYTGATGELVVSDGGTITLPTPTAGEKFGVRALRNDVTLISNGSIEASTSDRRIDSEGNSVFVSDGTEWYLVSGNEYFGFDIPDSALTQDLVAWYRFENGDARDYTATLDATVADSTAYDGTVNGATFQSSGGVTDFENGANSGAFDFGLDNGDIIDTNSDLGGVFSGDFSIVGWFKPQVSTVSSATAWLGFNDGNFNSWIGWEAFSDNTFRLTVDDGSVKNGPEDTWTDQYIHIGQTFDNSNGTNSGYKNGNFIGEVSGLGSVTTTGNEFHIGGYFTGDGRSLDCLQDDIRVYNRVLTESEISDIYNATKP